MFVEMSPFPMYSTKSFMSLGSSSGTWFAYLLRSAGVGLCTERRKTFSLRWFFTGKALSVVEAFEEFMVSLELTDVTISLLLIDFGLLALTTDADAGNSEFGKEC